MTKSSLKVQCVQQPEGEKSVTTGKVLEKPRFGFAARSFLTLGAVAALGISSALGADVYWNNAGTGGWQANSQWIGGVKPTSGDAACFTNVSVTVTDGDWAYVTTLGALKAGANATVTIDIGEDADTALQLSANGTSATIVKANSNRLVLTSTGGIAGDGKFSIEGGALKIGSMPDSSAQRNTLKYPLLEVLSPGVLILPDSSPLFVTGLIGDGIVMKETGADHLVFMGDQQGTAYNFAGYVATNVAFTAGNTHESVQDYFCRQSFSCPTNGYMTGFYLYNGMLGGTVFGNQSVPSSFGYMSKGYVLPFMAERGETGLFYTGTGGDVAGGTFRFDNTAAHSATFVVDGGEHGGITFANNWYNRARQSPDGKLTRIALRGDGAKTCILSGRIYSESPTSDVMIVKQGLGTWRFTDDKAHENRGPVFVEKGTLEYVSVAETNQPCSLGVANMLTTNFDGNASAAIPYVHKLGNGTADTSIAGLATFAYAGTSRVDIATRAIALDGAGRLMNSTNLPFSWTGFSAVPSGGTLVLDGDDASGAVVRDLTDGEGTLSVEKRGAGTWRISGTNDFSGRLDVKEGTLVIDGSNAGYTWFRFTFISMQENGNGIFPKLQEIALYDADGIRRNTGLVQHREVVSETSNDVRCQTVGNPYEILPGTVAYGVTGSYRFGSNGLESDDRDLHVAFDDSKDTPVVNGWTLSRATPNSTSSTPNGTPETAIPVVMRLTDDTTRIAAFDLCTGTSITTNAVLKSWRIEGSSDGVEWDVLTNVTFEIDLSALTRDNRYQHQNKWYSRHEQAYWGNTFAPGRVLSAADPGFPLRGHSNVECPNPLRNVIAVRVAPGAKLLANGGVELASMVGDPVNGTGTIDGFTFASEGVLEVASENLGREPVDMVFNITNCTAFANLEHWTATSSIGRRSRLRIRVTGENSVRVLPRGIAISIR